MQSKRKDEANSHALYLLGFAAFEGWATLTLGSWRGVGDAVSSVGVDSFWTVCCQSLMLAVFMALLGVFHETLGKLFLPRILVPATILALLCGAILCSYGAATPLDMADASPLPPAYLAVHFVGQGLSKFLLLAWFRAFSTFDIELVLKYALPILLSVASVSGAAVIAPTYALAALALVLGMLQLACLLRINADMPLSLGDGIPAKARPLALTLALSLVFCTLFRLLGSASDKSEGNLVLASFCGVYYTELGAVVVLLSGCVLAADYLNRRRTARSFSRAPFVTTIAFLSVWLAICLVGGDVTFAIRAFGQASFDLVSIIFFILLAYQLSCSAFHLFALNEAVFTAAYVPMSALATIMMAIGDGAMSTAMLTALILSAQSMVAFLAVMSWIIANNGLSDSIGIMTRALRSAFGASNQTESAPLCSDENAPSQSDATRASSDEPAEETVPYEQKEMERPRDSVISLLSRRYGLSERETSVMALLIKGRSMKRAAEELYLSVGTVSTYVKRIYAKMGIHTRQALIDLFDEAKHEAWSPRDE